MTKSWNVRTDLEPFRSKFNSLKTRINRLEEFLIGVVDVLSKRPDLGKLTKNDGIFAIPMVDIPGQPRITFFYIITKSGEVLLIDIFVGEISNISRIIL
jgi:hypothetical protein